MAIYQIIRGDIWCDKCKCFLANITFPKAVQEMLEKCDILCEKCGAKPLVEIEEFIKG